MTPEERQLISGLFDRMRSAGLPEKDRDAEALIGHSVRQNPDATYMLVQSVLVQEHVLQQADQRIRELEDYVRHLESQAQQARPAASSGGFLGGLFGGGRPAAQSASGSVPPVGRPADIGSRPMGAPPGWSQQGPLPPQQQPQQQAAGGGFMRTAMMTAAGVAGGMLLAESLRGMMGGSQAQAAQQPGPSSDQPAGQDTQYTDPTMNDPGTYDAADDGGSSGDWGGGGDLD
ncbi:MAG: DUF2076 domain-containing protein [Hyphomicrobiaceae bacterium]